MRAAGRQQARCERREAARDRYVHGYVHGYVQYVHEHVNGCVYGRVSVYVQVCTGMYVWPFSRGGGGQTGGFGTFWVIFIVFSKLLLLGER